MKGGRLLAHLPKYLCAFPHSFKFKSMKAEIVREVVKSIKAEVLGEIKAVKDYIQEKDNSKAHQ